MRLVLRESVNGSSEDFFEGEIQSAQELHGVIYVYFEDRIIMLSNKHWEILRKDRRLTIKVDNYRTRYYMLQEPAVQGWQCPICHRIYSPNTFECPYCNNHDTVTHLGELGSTIWDHQTTPMDSGYTDINYSDFLKVASGEQD